MMISIAPGSCHCAAISAECSFDRVACRLRVGMTTATLGDAAITACSACVGVDAGRCGTRAARRGNLVLRDQQVDRERYPAHPAPTCHSRGQLKQQQPA